MNNKNVSIVVPTYKEAENIPVLVKQIDEALKNRYQYEIIIVDDNSQDGIKQKVQELQENKYNVKLKVRTNERGLSSAVIAGLKMATGELFLVMDADLSHPPEKVPELLDRITNNGADFVIGSRFVEGGGAAHFNWFRKLNAGVSKLLARPLIKATDPMAGFFAFPKHIIDGKYETLNPLGWKIGLEISVKCSPKNLQEVPIQFKERLHGESKLSLKEQINYLIHVKRLFEFKYESFSELIKFGIIGCTGIVVNLFFVFIAFDLISLPYELALVVGFIIALSTNFLLNRRFTFKHAHRGDFFKQYAGFFITCLIGFAINWLISVYLFEHIQFFRHYYLFTTFLGIICGMVFNFLGSKFFVFKKL
ncbi:MAG: glycosyltransferase family 2 protein [bacterium]|nr:glycosyltransferase family 2 protein [bacterium]